ncbi:hypothetical protein [Streptomyces tropicalis]|uniref:Integral membrane protein n=1 Tax=Streptomyces tropicalis TaxID=3034234 RepID=A0ABT6A9N8_9ACTN|nr:hypothetical protein [Streptomyces tropicalis]MDF3301056.1 hypothetical protein [Streptomyces tropicalis]
MPDRLRLLTLAPHPAQGGERGAVLLRERPSSPPDAPSGGRKSDGRGGGRGAEDNPFAPPPEGTPDSPWRPRTPADGDGSDGDGEPGGSEGDGHSPWGRQWSDRQPGRSPGGFGERPQRPGGPQQPGGGPGPGLRWDPTDPAQRRARYALLCGMWAFFFALFGWAYVALLLGALAVYWGGSALRAKPRAGGSPGPAPEGRPQTTAAISGLVTAVLAIVLVAANFTAQMVYSDYYTCTNDALTNEARQSCDQHLPKELRGVLGVKG